MDDPINGDKPSADAKREFKKTRSLSDLLNATGRVNLPDPKAMQHVSLISEALKSATSPLSEHIAQATSALAFIEPTRKALESISKSALEAPHLAPLSKELYAPSPHVVLQMADARVEAKAKQARETEQLELTRELVEVSRNEAEASRKRELQALEEAKESRKSATRARIVALGTSLLGLLVGWKQIAEWFQFLVEKFG